jgi:hypothetical protein
MAACTASLVAPAPALRVSGGAKRSVARRAGPVRVAASVEQMAGEGGLPAGREHRQSSFPLHLIQSRRPVPDTTSTRVCSTK